MSKSYSQICVSNRKDTVVAVKVCLLNKITFVVVGDIYSRHMFRTLGTSQLNIKCQLVDSYADFRM